MASTMITPDRDAVVSEIEIAAPPERVFQALIDREQAMQWGSNQSFEVMLWEIDARPGGKWHFVSRERSGKNPPGLPNFDHHGEYLEVDPPRLLLHTWYANWHEDPAQRTVVRWELTPTKSGTHLKVTHSGLGSMQAAREGYSQGWPGLVEAIKNFVERASTPTATITADHDAVVSEIHVAAPPERVFQALIDPGQVKAWWKNDKVGIETFDLDPKPGGKWRYDTNQTNLNVNGVSKFHCEGEVLEFDPPRTLAYTWIANWHDDKSRRTVVRWQLTAEGSGTRVKVTHSGLAQENAARKDYSGGWPGVLGQLKNFVEA